MKILWPNVVALGLAVFALCFFIAHRDTIGLTVQSMAWIGPGHSADEKTFGLLILGILCVTVVALVKVLTNKRPK